MNLRKFDRIRADVPVRPGVWSKFKSVLSNKEYIISRLSENDNLFLVFEVTPFGAASFGTMYAIIDRDISVLELSLLLDAVHARAQQDKYFI